MVLVTYIYETRAMYIPFRTTVDYLRSGGCFVQNLFPLRGERISNLIDFSREFFPIAGWGMFYFTTPCHYDTGGMH